MNHSRLATALLLFACIAVVGAVRTLPRFLGGVADVAAERARAEIAADLKQASTEAAAPDAVDRWIAEHRGEYDAKVATHQSRLKALLTFEAADGREHPYLADHDSYLWLRLARNQLKNGTPCDEVVDGVCRDTYTHAPVGRDMLYDKSLHVDAIVALHRLITTFAPNFPLSSSSFFVPVIVGMLGVIPAFFLGKRFGGLPGAVTASLVSALNPAFLIRSMGSDNDVWNIVLPLYAGWAAVEALRTPDVRRRVLFAAGAAVAVGLHAAVWRGWMITEVIVLGGIGATLGYTVLRSLLHERDLRLWRDSRIQAILTVAVTYFVAAAIAVGIAGAEPGFVQSHLGALDLQGAPAPPPGFDAEAKLWPSEFTSVAELLVLQGGDVTLYTTNVPLLILAFLGSTLLALGPLPWTVLHWGVLGLSAAATGYVYLGVTSSFTLAGWLLFVPVALAAAAALPGDRRRDDLERGALVVLVWLAAAYHLGTGASRFVMFLGVPVGISAGVVAGWLYDLARQQLEVRAGHRIALGVGIAAVAALLAYPLYRGYVTGRDYLPHIDDGWWQAFTDIAEKAPADAIVNVWWHDGHWAKYVADRRVSADGASLRAHILFWFTRALLSPDDARAAGMLRMLDCGSDATPYPEGKLGAYGKLRAAGLSVLAAQALLDQLVNLDRNEAERLLSARGVAPAAAAGILEATHCTPPQMYLVLSDKLVSTAGWGSGLWDFRRAYVIRRARHLPRDEGLRELTEEVGYTPSEARQLYREAQSLHDKHAEDEFIAPELGFFTKTWVECAAGDTGFNLCPLAAKVGAAQTIDAFQYPTQSPGAGRLRIRKQVPGAAPAFSYRTPGTILIARQDSFVTATVSGATDPGLAVLIDIPGNRILMAEAALLASTFTKLVFLDGRYLPHFEKVGEYESVKNRVVTYRIRTETALSDPKGSGPVEETPGAAP